MEEGEEGRRPICIKEEQAPSQEEVQEHMASHVPFRSWCPFCIKGKAKSSPHRRKKDEGSDVPVISMDY
eukprot:7250346-Lingulodinium_polyedra.AAC.1